MTSTHVLFVAGTARWTDHRRYIVKAGVAKDHDVVAEIRIEGNDGRGAGWVRRRGGMRIRLEAIDEICVLLQRVKNQAGTSGGAH